MAADAPRTAAGMRTRQAVLLLLLGISTVIAALRLGPTEIPPSPEMGQPVFPGIAPKLAQAARIEISGGGKSTTLIAQGDGWGVAERGLYPAQPQKLRALFAGLGELRLIEPRTSNPVLFARLGVDDPSKSGSTAVSLRVRTADGGTLAELVLGHSSLRTQGGLPQSVYLRRPSDTSAWLAEGAVAAEADPQSWLVRDIIDIPRARIAQVDVQHDSALIVLTRDGEAMHLANPPPGKLDTYHIDEIGQALEGVTLADVQRGVLPGTPAGSAVFTTTDGLAIGVTLSKDGKLLWASFTATGPGAEAYARLTGWVFQLPEWRESVLAPSQADLMSKEEPPK